MFLTTKDGRKVAAADNAGGKGSRAGITRFLVCERLSFSNSYSTEAGKEESTTSSERYSQTCGYNVWNHFQFHL